jgi:hypothetical protein
MIMPNSEKVTIEAELIVDTDNAWLLNDGDTDGWVPKSQGECLDSDEPEIGRVYKFEIPEWLAIEKGFV